MNFKDIYTKQMDDIHVPEGLLENMTKEAKSLESKADCTKSLDRGAEKRQGRRWNRRVVAAVLIGLLFVSGATAYAGVHIFGAKDVAQQLEKPKIASKFEKISPVCQVQENDTFRITYLGAVTGSKLSDNDLESDSKKTYYVVAVERRDGRKMEYTDEPRLYVTPLIRGYAPWHFNLLMAGGESAESQIIDNVRYYLVESDDVEIFAGHGIYLAVADRAPDSDQYSFDEKTGVITANKDYKGLNMLFELKIDPSKADEKKAKEYLKEADQ